MQNPVIGQLIILESSSHWASRMRGAAMVWAEPAEPGTRDVASPASRTVSAVATDNGSDAEDEPPRARSDGAYLPRGSWLVETRFPAACLEALRTAPASLVLVEFTLVAPESTLKLIHHIAEGFPAARVVVVAERGLEAYEWLAREAGAAAWFAAPRDMAPILGLARRHLSGSSLPGRSLWEEIVADLPWSEGADAVS